MKKKNLKRSHRGEIPLPERKGQNQRIQKYRHKIINKKK